MELRRSKNAATYIVVPIVDADGDVVTGAAGLDSELNYWDDGNAPQSTFTDCTNEATEIGSTGVYYLSLTQAEMNHDYVYVVVKTSTSGAKTQHILINCKPQAADVTAVSGDATAADNLELMFDGTGYAGGTTKLDVNAASIANGAITAAAIATDAIDNDAIAANAVTEIQSGLSTLDAAGVRTAVGLASANLDTQIGDLPTNTELGTALAAADDAVLDAVAALNDFDPTSDVVAHVTLVDTTTTNTDMVAAAPSAASVADAVWDEAAAGHTDAGKAGQQLWTDVDAILADTGELQTNQGDWATAAGFSTHSAADVWGVATRTITALDEDTTTIDIDTAVAAGVPAASAVADAVWDEALAGHAGAGSAGAALSGASAPAASAIADAVWDETLAGHTGVGSAGAALSAAGGSGDPWSTALPGAYEAGTAGAILGTTIPAAIDAVDNYVDSEVTALTNELAKVPKSDGTASWNSTALAAIQGECTDALEAYDPPTKAELDAADDAVLAAVAALNDFDPTSDVVAHVTLVDTTTTNTDMVSDVASDVTAVKAVTDQFVFTTPNLVDASATASVDNAAIADAVWDEALAGHATGGTAGAALSAAGGGSGTGAITWTYTLTTPTGTAIGDAEVWVTSDEAGATVVASGRTNASGVVTFYLDAGDYFIWSQKTGYNFTNPDEETVSA